MDNVLLVTPYVIEEDRKATRNNILVTLKEILEVTKVQDTILIYFAEYGLDREGVSYLLPQGTRNEFMKLAAFQTSANAWACVCACANSPRESHA